MRQSRRGFMRIAASAGISSVLMFEAPFAWADQIDYDVPGEFAILKQKGDTCWATAGTMMYNWRKGTTYSVDDLTQMAGDPYAGVYSQKKSLKISDTAGWISFLGLKAEPPASYSPTTIRDMLKKRGLLWATTLSSAQNCIFSLHARILRGIHGDDASLNLTTLTIIDPATGTSSPVSINQFYKDFEGFAKSENICDPDEPLLPQILHFP
jgi:Papain-like cysteine protease AvrRpt2